MAPNSPEPSLVLYDLESDALVDLPTPALRTKQVVHTAVPAPDNALLVGGDFDYTSGVFTGPAAKLTDTVVPLGTHQRGRVSALVVQADGSTVVGGAIFPTSDEPGVGGGLVRRLADGRPDPSFANATINTGTSTNPFVYYIFKDWVEYPDGKLTISGGFTHDEGQLRYRSIARYTAEGALDTGFQAGLESGTPYNASLALDEQQRLYFAAQSTTETTPREVVLQRLDDSGNPDTSFPDLGLTGYVNDLTLDNNGRLLLAGDFAIEGEESRRALARYRSIGTLDDVFVLDPRVAGTVTGIEIRHDGYIYAWSTSESLRTDRDDAYLIRLMPDGALDESFVVLGLTSGMTTFGMRDDGRIFVGGWRPFPTGFLQPLEYGLPSIATMPESVQAEAGGSIVLSVEASGGELSYQWRRNGVEIDGATASSYEIAAATTADAGFYDVVITNALGSTISGTAVVAVAAAGADFAVGEQAQVGRGFKQGGKCLSATW